MEYDRIKDITTVLLFPEAEPGKWKREPSNLFVGYAYAGTIPTPPQFVSFFLTTLIWYSQYYSCHDVALLLDQKTRLQFPTTITRSTFPGVFNSTDFIAATLSLDDFLRIVNAKLVEGEVCGTAITFTPEQMEALRDLASRMNP
ncbi:MAG: hypothetical protein M1482_06170 [Chloroflexi bacterium]|nr:hypothetical protein [Chloroflexota bacterium]